MQYTDMKKKMSNKGIVEINGFKLHYTIEGTGTLALVIGSALYYPRTFSQNLRKHLKLVFIDHRGFVPSPEPIDPVTITLDLIIDDIEHVRKVLGLERFIIIGHSGHGYMALEYAKKYPDNILQVILIGMGPNQSSERHRAADQYLGESVCPRRKAVLEKDLEKLPEDLQQFPKKRFITFCLRLGARSWYDFTFDASPLWKDVYVNMPIIDYIWGVIFRDIDITKNLENFDKPIYLALGKFDYLVAPFYSWNKIRSKFTNLTIRLFEQSSHTPQYEEPRLFDEELLQWISHSTKNS